MKKNKKNKKKSKELENFLADSRFEYELTSLLRRYGADGNYSYIVEPDVGGVPVRVNIEAKYEK